MSTHPDDPTWSDLWRAIDNRRVELDMSLSELYRRSGVSQKTFKHMSDGRPLKSLVKQRAICRALRWAPSAIDDFFRDGDPPWSIERALEQARDSLLEATHEADLDGGLEDIRHYQHAQQHLRELEGWKAQLDGPPAPAGEDERGEELVRRLDDLEARLSELESAQERVVEVQLEDGRSVDIEAAVTGEQHKVGDKGLIVVDAMKLARLLGMVDETSSQKELRSAIHEVRNLLAHSSITMTSTVRPDELPADERVEAERQMAEYRRLRPEEFAVAAEGAGTKPTKATRKRASRPRPPAEQ